MQPTPDLDTVVRLAVAALCGLAVGIEREWSGHTAGSHVRFAGIRTHLLLGGLAGIAGILTGTGFLAAGVGLLAGGMAVILVAYFNASRSGSAEGLEATTEVAALVVLGLGVLAGLGHLALASGATAIVVVALGEKTRLHGAVARIDEHELRAAFHFAVLALVVLPILPAGSYGPLGGIRPRELWMVVLVFSGLNFLGYIARKAVGRSRGDAVAGALGGVISSTAVTWQFSRRSRDEETASGGLAAGVVAACTVLIPRILVLSAVLNAGVARALVPLLAAPFLTGAALVTWSMLRRWSTDNDVGSPNEDESPLRLGSAIRMAVAFQAALLAINFVQARYGEHGVLTSAALLGLTDMDALTLSMNRLGETPGAAELAATAIAVGVAANTVLKLLLATTLGSARFRVLAGVGLAILLVASVTALILR